jgi:hypothetical protein
MELIQEIRSWMSSFMARPVRALTVAERWSWALVRLKGKRRETAGGPDAAEETIR